MPAYDRNTYCRSGNLYGVIGEDFFGFSNQFHFLLGIAIFLKHIAVRNSITMDRIVVRHRSFYALIFVFQLLYGFHPCSCDRLIGRDHNTLDTKLAQRRQSHKHLDRRAVRIGNNLILCGKHIGIDFGDHELLSRIHTPSRRVIHHYGTHLGKLRCPFLRGIAPCREQSHIGLEGDGLGHAHYFIFLPLEGNGFSYRFLGGYRNEFCYWKIALGQDFQHHIAYQSGSAYYGYFHNISFLCIIRQK